MSAPKCSLLVAHKDRRAAERTGPKGSFKARENIAIRACDVEEGAVNEESRSEMNAGDGGAWEEEMKYYGKRRKGWAMGR